MKYHTYTVVRANGDVEAARVPTFFDPYSVAKRLVHSLVFLHLPKGHDVYGHGFAGERIIGPAVLLIHEEEYYQVAHAPVNDIDACRLFREYVPQPSTC